MDIENNAELIKMHKKVFINFLKENNVELKYIRKILIKYDYYLKIKNNFISVYHMSMMSFFNNMHLYFVNNK